MYDALPDAPWIRDAERYGMSEQTPVYCPICSEEAEIFYVDQAGEIVGCDHCIQTKDACEYDP